MKKDGFAVKAVWRNVDLPKLTLQRANKYLEGTIISMRKFLKKQTYVPKKDKKCPTNVATTIEEIKPTIALIYVLEKYEVCKEEIQQEIWNFSGTSAILESFFRSEENLKFF